MTFKVLHNHLCHSICITRVGTGIAHRTAASVKVLPHDHRYLPHPRIGTGRARRNHAVVEYLVVKRVGPGGWSVFVDRHGRVVGEVWVVQHFVHFVSAHRQERSTHASNIRHLDTAVRSKDLTLSGNFTSPLLLGELLAKAVTVDQCLYSYFYC